MINVQNSFAHAQVEGLSIGAQLAVPFSSPNTKGNGLIAVAFCLTSFPYPPASLTPIDLVATDTAGNIYLRIGGCGRYDGSTWTAMLAAWYVQSSVGGPNAVWFIERSTMLNYLMAGSVFEYPGTLGAPGSSAPGSGIAYPEPVQGVDDAAFGSELATHANLSLTISAPAADLLFAFGAEYGQGSSLALDSSSLGFTTEQTESISPSGLWATPVPTLAVAQIAASAGLKTVQFDFSAAQQGLQFALFAAMSLTAVPGQPPPPTPTPVPTPSPGTPGGPLPPLSSGVWPTIF
jgi:hypothetical protein